MASPIFRHYPELPNPVVPPIRGTDQKSLNGFTDALNRSLINFTQRLNQELRIIVDQLSAIAGTGTTGISVGNLTPNPDGATTTFHLGRAANLILIFSTGILLEQGPGKDYTFTAGTTDVFFTTAPLVGDHLIYVILA